MDEDRDKHACGGSRLEEAWWDNWVLCCIDFIDRAKEEEYATSGEGCDCLCRLPRRDVCILETDKEEHNSRYDKEEAYKVELVCDLADGAALDWIEM